MTLAYSTRYKRYDPVVSTTDFLVTFPIWGESDLRVVVDGADLSADDFMVTATFSAGRSDNASITLDTAVSGVSVEIYGETPAERSTNYLASSPLLGTNLQRDADKLAAMIQEAVRDGLRSIKLPVGENPDIGEIPADEQRALVGGPDGFGWGPTVGEVSGAQGLFQAASSSEQRSFTAKMRDVVSLSDYIAPTDSMTGLAAAFVDAFTDGDTLRIGPEFNGVALPAASHSVPDGKSLIIEAELLSNVAGATIEVEPGVALIECRGAGRLRNVVLKLTDGTPTVRNCRFYGRNNTAGILIQGEAGAVFRGAIITGCEFSTCNYGILSQGADLLTPFAAKHTLAGLVIANNRFYDMRGDAIALNRELNGDRNVITGNVIDYITGSANAFWGIGISVAESQGFTISNNTLTRMRQGIHAEYSSKVKIFGNKLDKINADYSTSSGLDVAAISVVGADVGTITYSDGDSGYEVDVYGVTDNDVDRGDIRIDTGFVVSVYGPPVKRLVLARNRVRNGNILCWIGSEDGEYDTFATIEDNVVSNGMLRVNGRSNFVTVRNNTCIRQRANGPALVLTPNIDLGDNRTDFLSPSGPSTYLVEGNRAMDEFGCPSAGYQTGTSTYSKTNLIPGFVMGQVEARNNNFAISGSGLAVPKTMNREIYDNFAGANPYGIEFVAGDIYVDTSTGARKLCTVGGSYNRASDTFSVYDAANRVIVSTSLTWTDAFHHYQGQAIACTNIGAASATLSTGVVRVWADGGFYYMELANTISAANSTTGTISAANTPTFVTI